jgi:hypothetical protein
MMSRRRDGDTQIVAQAIDQLGAPPLHQPPLPDPSIIWWKAQFLRRREAERQAAAPIDVGDRVHLGASILGAAALAAGVWDRLPALALTPLTGLTLLGGLAILLSVIAAAALDALRER